MAMVEDRYKQQKVSVLFMLIKEKGLGWCVVRWVFFLLVLFGNIMKSAIVGMSKIDKRQGSRLKWRKQNHLHRSCNQVANTCRHHHQQEKERKVRRGDGKNHRQTDDVESEKVFRSFVSNQKHNNNNNIDNECVGERREEQRKKLPAFNWKPARWGSKNINLNRNGHENKHTQDWPLVLQPTTLTRAWRLINIGATTAIEKKVKRITRRKQTNKQNTWKSEQQRNNWWCFFRLRVVFVRAATVRWKGEVNNKQSLKVEQHKEKPRKVVSLFRNHQTQVDKEGKWQSPRWW